MLRWSNAKHVAAVRESSHLTIWPYSHGGGLERTQKKRVIHTGYSSQRKGADGERELASVLQGYGYQVRRGGSMSFGKVPDLIGLDGIHIEVKRVERLNVPEAMRQAIRDAERFQDGAPTLFHRRSREPWLVTMRLSDWIDIYASHSI